MPGRERATCGCRVAGAGVLYLTKFSAIVVHPSFLAIDIGNYPTAAVSISMAKAGRPPPGAGHLSCREYNSRATRLVGVTQFVEVTDSHTHPTTTAAAEKRDPVKKKI